VSPLPQKSLDRVDLRERAIEARIAAFFVGAERDEVALFLVERERFTQASITRESEASTSIAGQRPRAPRRRSSTTCPSRMPRTSSAMGSSMSPPSTSTV
jgi:hypothetical protein